MEDVEYLKMSRYEDVHWWFRGKRAVVARAIERLGRPRAGARCLDVGCGTGANLVLLARYGEAHGIDVSPLALELCRRRGLTNLTCGSAAELPYRDGQFDLVTMLDVLYHRRVTDVAAALGEAYRVCRAGALLVITDSAFEALRGPHDAAVHTARRFRRGELGRAVATSGFAVVQCSYMNTLLFPIALAVRLLERRRARAGVGSSLGPPPPLNGVLAAIYALESRLLRHTNLPFGLSTLVIGRKLG